MAKTALGGIARRPRGFAALLFCVALTPALVIAYWLLSDLFGHSRHLGSNPIKQGEHLLGIWTLRLLFATLAITPLRALSGWQWLGKHRRALGLFTFGYATLHLSTWALLDVQVIVDDLVGWNTVKKDLFERPFIAIGMAAFTLMIPLAVTSTKAAMRRLGGRWSRLHRLIYGIGILGVTHYWMAVKRDVREPALYALVLTVLLGWRLVAAWRARVRPAADGELARR